MTAPPAHGEGPEAQRFGTMVRWCTIRDQQDRATGHHAPAWPMGAAAQALSTQGFRKGFRRGYPGVGWVHA